MKTMCMDDVLKITPKNCTGNLWAHVKSESRERFEYIFIWDIAKSVNRLAMTVMEPCIMAAYLVAYHE